VASIFCSEAASAVAARARMTRTVVGVNLTISFVKVGWGENVELIYARIRASNITVHLMGPQEEEK